MQTVYNNPQYWRERADEARATASLLCNWDIRAAMIRIAVEYDQIASVVEQPLVRRPSYHDEAGDDRAFVNTVTNTATV